MEEQLSMFNNDVFVKPETKSLVLSRWNGGRLTKAQRTFNRLVGKVESIRVQMEERAQELAQVLAEYAEHLHPRLQRELGRRKELVVAFGPFLNKGKLKRKGDRDTLRRLLDQQLHFIVDHEGPLEDPGLLAVFKQVTGLEFQDVVHQETQEMRQMFEWIFDEVGIEVDVSNFGPGMSDAEAAAAAAQIAEGFQVKEEQADNQAHSERPKSSRQLEREERERQAEELRKTSIASIYKQLARVVHPDLEQDADRRRQKEAVMQELTAAYRQHDLHTLLRLELEWIRREKGNLDRMTEEKLAIYNGILKEQTIQLTKELNDMVLDPRYQPIVVPDGPFDVRVRDVAGEVRATDERIEDYETLLARLKSSDALAAVHAALRGFREEERMTRMAFRFGPQRKSRKRNPYSEPF